MMKQVLNIATVLLLLASTTGVAVVQHFCGESLRFSELTVDQATSICCADVNAMAMDCCHNDVIFNYVDDAFTQIASVPTEVLECMNVFVVAYVVPVIDETPSSSNQSSFTYESIALHGSTISIPILHQAFLI